MTDRILQVAFSVFGGGFVAWEWNALDIHPVWGGPLLGMALAYVLYQDWELTRHLD